MPKFAQNLYNNQNQVKFVVLDAHDLGIVFNSEFDLVLSNGLNIYEKN